jgi:hypothetical protein
MTVEAQLNLSKLKNKVKEAISNEVPETQPSSGSSSESSVEQKLIKAVEDPFAKYKDNGMTDGIHANYLKEVVFSKTALQSMNKSYNVPSNGKEELLSKTFTLKDDLYMMAYFEHSFYNEMMKDKKEVPENTYVTPRIWFEVNGKESGKKGNNKFTKNIYEYDFREWTSLAFPKYSLTDFDDFNPENPQLAFYSYVLPLLQTGDNKVKVNVSFDVIKYNGNGGPEATMTEEERTVYTPSAPMASGEMTLQVNNIAEVKELLIKSGYIPQAAQNNPALEKQIINVYNAGYSDSKAVKAIIYDSDWSIRQNDYGVILGRYVGVKVVTSTPDPAYYIIWDMSAEQPYSGGGQYSTKIVLSTYSTPCYTVSSSLFN